MQPTKGSGEESNISLPNAVMLQQSIRMKLLSSAQNPAATVLPMDGSAALPQHSTLSSYFVTAFGRLGRWKRELARSRNPTSLACAAGFDADADAHYTGDVLRSKEGLD